VAREVWIVALHLLDEAPGVLAADEDLERISERERGRRREAVLRASSRLAPARLAATVVRMLRGGDVGRRAVGTLG